MESCANIARPYAKAVFEYALLHKQLDSWQQGLQGAALLAADERVAKLLADPNVTTIQTLDIFFDVLKNILNDKACNFLRLLADYRRLNILPEIAERFKKLKDEYEKVIEVEVASAFELTTEQKEKLTQALNKRLQLEIKLHCQTDENLLGGAVIRAGDLIIDGSGLGKLKELNNYLFSEL
jgi:F-type H+-transporting ATPase subunit delta